jgi:hypothetical protein
MIKITDQYFWNFVFHLFFACLIVMATIILETEARITYLELGLFDIALITLSAWRLGRFISVDPFTKFFREQFYDLKKTARSYSLEVPATGPRRAILEIILNPWQFSLGIGALVTFVYLLTSYATYPLLLLALSGLISLLEVATNYIVERSKEE